MNLSGLKIKIKCNQAYDVPRPEGEGEPVVGASVVRASDSTEGEIVQRNGKHLFLCQFGDQKQWMFRLEFVVRADSAN